MEIEKGLSELRQTLAARLDAQQALRIRDLARYVLLPGGGVWNLLSGLSQHVRGALPVREEASVNPFIQVLAK